MSGIVSVLARWMSEIDEVVHEYVVELVEGWIGN